MPPYYLRCGENTKSIILQVSRAIHDGIIILSKCIVCGNKRLRFSKKEEANWALSNLDIKKFLCKIPILRDILF